MKNGQKWHPLLFSPIYQRIQQLSSILFALSQAVGKILKRGMRLCFASCMVEICPYLMLVAQAWLKRPKSGIKIASHLQMRKNNE